MKYFWDFIEFITMQELNQPDSIVRNYVIECDYARRPIQPSLKNDFVRLGLARLDLEVTQGREYLAWGELLSALRSVGCTIHEVFIMAYLGQFYNYHRIKKGELKKWPMRRTLMS